MIDKEIIEKIKVSDKRNSVGVHIRLEPNILELYKKTGKGHVTLMQGVLKEYALMKLDT